jgi:hypothetical protein
VPGYSRACPSVSWHLVDEKTYKGERGVGERGTRDGSSLASLCSTHWIELYRWLLGIVPMWVKGCALPFGVIGVLAHSPGHPTTPGGLARLTSGPSPHLQCAGW